MDEYTFFQFRNVKLQKKYQEYAKCLHCINVPSANYFALKTLGTLKCMLQ